MNDHATTGRHCPGFTESLPAQRGGAKRNGVRRPGGRTSAVFRAGMARRRRGAMLPLIAVCLVILFVAVTLSIDVARIQLTRAELRTATDAAARAGAETLGRTQNPGLAVQAAVDIAALNEVAGRPLTLRPNQIELGRTVPNAAGLFAFTPGVNLANAVRVTGLRTDASADGAVPMLFGPLFGVTKFQPIQVAAASRLDRDISLVLDVSGSMNESGKFPGLKNALRVFLAQLAATQARERVSLNVYSTTARKLVPLTEDMSLIDRAFSRERPDGFTAIGEGLKLGDASVQRDALARPFAEKTVILMTDGIHNTGVSPDVVARGMRGVKVHTITFGADVNQPLMDRVAQITGGISLHAANNRQLEEAFTEIALQLPVLLTE